MKLLVTGGCGFIGSNFIRYWMEKYPKDSIVNVDKMTYAANPKNLEGIKGDLNTVEMDINNPSIETHISWSDIIVHFAAESHVDNSITNAEEFIKTNVQGTYNLLRLAQKHNKRFHHVSTDEVFGSLALDSKEKFNEKTPYDPKNPYSATKAASDHLVRAFFNTYGLPITISNCSNNFGPYQNKEKLLPKAISNLLEGKKVPIYGKGENIRDWLYVGDHCLAIDLIIEKGTPGETYCIGGMTEDITNIELIQMLVKSLQTLRSINVDDPIEFVEDRKGHDQKYAVDFSKAGEELGYCPQFDIKDNLEATIKWYGENEWFWKDK